LDQTKGRLGPPTVGVKPLEFKTATQFSNSNVQASVSKLAWLGLGWAGWAGWLAGWLGWLGLRNRKQDDWKCLTFLVV